jgi:hypothetical protein
VEFDKKRGPANAIRIDDGKVIIDYNKYIGFVSYCPKDALRLSEKEIY